MTKPIIFSVVTVLLLSRMPSVLHANQEPLELEVKKTSGIDELVIESPEKIAEIEGTPITYRSCIVKASKNELKFHGHKIENFEEVLLWEEWQRRIKYVAEYWLHMNAKRYTQIGAELSNEGIGADTMSMFDRFSAMLEEKYKKRFANYDEFAAFIDAIPKDPRPALYKAGGGEKGWTQRLKENIANTQNIDELRNLLFERRSGVENDKGQIKTVQKHREDFEKDYFLALLKETL